MTRLIPDIFSGKYNIKCEIKYFKDVFNHYDFIYSYPAIFVPYILFSIFRLLKIFVLKNIYSLFIRNISSIVATLIISILIIKTYQAIWYKTENIFFERRNQYYPKTKNINIDISNYKDFKWEGGYHGYSDPFFYGTLTFLSDSLVKYSYGLYDGSSWNFPIRYLLKYPNYKKIDTFLVIEDTVILFKGYIYDSRLKEEYKATAVDIFEIDDENLIFSPISSFLYPDSLNKTYLQMHKR